jgi:F-type H+-transporting ATPase subunit b
MNLIFEPGIWDLSNPEIWVGVGLLIFFGILIAVGVPKTMCKPA